MSKSESREERGLLSHHEQMLDAQNGCFPCKLCGGKAVITDAGIGAGYYVRCENSRGPRRSTRCMLDDQRLGGWAYNVMDWWNRLHTRSDAERPARTAEGDQIEADAITELFRRYQQRGEYTVSADVVGCGRVTIAVGEEAALRPPAQPSALVEAREAAIRECAAIVEKGQETWTNQGDDGGSVYLTPRKHGNLTGLAYRDAILARAATPPPPEPARPDGAEVEPITFRDAHRVKDWLARGAPVDQHFIVLDEIHTLVSAALTPVSERG